MLAACCLLIEATLRCITRHRQGVIPRRVRRWIWLAIVVVIGAAMVVMVGDVSQLGDRLGDFRWWAFCAALGLALANYAIRFLRWQIYLRHQGVAVPTG